MLISEILMPRDEPAPGTVFFRRDLGDCAMWECWATPLGPGLPYGPWSRFILAWMWCEALRTGSRELHVEPSLYDFLAEVDPRLRATGSQGLPAFVHDHLERVLACQFSYRQDLPELSIASATAVWEKKRSVALRPGRGPRRTHFVRLARELFDRFMAHEIVIDTTVLDALAPSPLALDLYLGLAEACFARRDPFALSWREVYERFAFDTPRSPTPKQLGAFRDDVRLALARIAAAWPRLRYHDDDALTVWPISRGPVLAQP